MKNRMTETENRKRIFVGRRTDGQCPNNRTNRRNFLQSGLALGAGLAANLTPNSALATETKTTQSKPEGFFTLGQRKDHWWLSTPEGKPFFTMGLNHIDPASLRYPENVDIWREKYGGSTIRWIKESVAPNLKAWGFNTVGWVQEVTVKKWQHSRPFTVDEYRALDVPYCHLLPFTESHQWEKHTVHYDFRSEDWKEWVDYVARSHCAELADETNRRPDQALRRSGARKSVVNAQSSMRRSTAFQYTILAICRSCVTALLDPAYLINPGQKPERRCAWSGLL